MIALERFLADHYHELFGLICEAATAGRKGGELSLWLTQAGKTLKQRLRLQYESLGDKERLDVPASDKVSEKRKVGA